MKSLIKKMFQGANRVMGFGDKSPAGKYPSDISTYYAKGLFVKAKAAKAAAGKESTAGIATQKDFNVNLAEGYLCFTISIVWTLLPNVEIIPGWFPVGWYCFALAALYLLWSYAGFKRAAIVKDMLHKQALWQQIDLEPRRLTYER